MADKRLEYIGPLRPGVVITGADGRPIRADYGEPIDVDAETAKGLLSQDIWREPKPGPKPKATGEEGGN
jgi:hypothetical protein